MPEVVGVRFKRTGRIYYFDPIGIEVGVDEVVVVETSRGIEAGWVVMAPRQMPANQIGEPLKPILRKAGNEDLRQREEYQKKEEEAFRQCEAKIAAHRLPMKLVSAEYKFDGSRLTFCYASEERIDFRELLRDLSSTFKTRIELKQVGVRDKAKVVGGVGQCGRALCCAAFMCNFPKVTIKMAKEQDMPLNPTKISGVCGRLLCCLSYENELYRTAKQELPHVGEKVDTPHGPGKVTGTNVLKKTVLVQMESEAIIEVADSQVQRLECRSM